MPPTGVEFSLGFLRMEAGEDEASIVELDFAVAAGGLCDAVATDTISKSEGILLWLTEFSYTSGHLVIRQ